MMNFSVGKSLNRSDCDELHERRGVGVEVVRAGGVEGRVARRADVDHRRHVELDHLLVERIPVLVGERRVVPVAAGRVGVEVAADEAELVDAALAARRSAILRRHARRLRQLADADEVLREERRRRGGSGRCRCSVQCVLTLRVADVVRHAGGARREDREVGAALAAAA